MCGHINYAMRKPYFCNVVQPSGRTR